MTSNYVTHRTGQPLRAYPGLSSSQGMARHAYLRQLGDLNEPLEVLKVAGAVKQIFQPGDGEAPEGAGGPSQLWGGDRATTQLSFCPPSPKAQAVKEMASMALGFNYDAIEKVFIASPHLSGGRQSNSNYKIFWKCR